MTEETGAAAPTTEPAAVSAPAEGEQATQTQERPNQEAAAENVDTKQPEDGAGEQSEEGASRKLSRSQRQQRKIARLSTMLAEREEALEQFRKSAPTGPQPPKEEDFNGDYFAYQRALTKFDTEQVVSAAIEKVAPKDNKPDPRQLDRAEALEELQERVATVSKHIPDFDSSLAELHKRVGTLSDAVLEEISESDRGEVILYHLAKNLDLAASINKMSARDAAREIGRLEAKAVLPQPRKQTQAGAPLAPIGGGAAPPAKDPAKMSTAEYVAWRKSGGGGKPAF